MAFNQASATVAAAPAPTASDAPDVGNPCTTAIATRTSRKPLAPSTPNGSPVIPKYRWSYDRTTSSSPQSRSGNERPHFHASITASRSTTSSSAARTASVNVGAQATPLLVEYAIGGVAVSGRPR